MQEDRMIELLVEMHIGQPRLGPGNKAGTLRALGMCTDLPDAPRILDVGCGTGAQTLDLANATYGVITATDLFPVFLETLRANAKAQGLEDRIRIEQADMAALPYPEESFDLIWCEGAAYIMGFDNALKSWQPLVKPGGWLCLTEVSWLRDDAPQECHAFWMDHYPAMRSTRENLEAAHAAGWEPAGHFTVPTEAWTHDYYGPLKQSLPGFRARNASDKDAQAVADMTETEMRLFDAYSDYYSYVFYILRRPR